MQVLVVHLCTEQVRQQERQKQKQMMVVGSNSNNINNSNSKLKFTLILLVKIIVIMCFEICINTISFQFSFLLSVFHEIARDPFT
jgi:hypothetical protein